MHAIEMGTKQPSGRWLMKAPTYDQVGLLMPTGWQPFDMTKLEGYLFGNTPAFTTPNGTHFNMDEVGAFTVELICHEATHYWQANKRMGRLSYWATYCWHVALDFFKDGPTHIHADHEMEIEARAIGHEAQTLVLQMSAGFVFDVEAYLVTKLPILRS